MLKGKIGIKDNGVVGKEYEFEGYDISAYFGGILDESVQFEVVMCRVRSNCDTHFELLCKLGVLVRYAKTECRAENAEGYEKNYFGEKAYTPTLKKKYIIPNLGWIELESLDICAFELENEYLKVSCESVEERKIFGILKQAHTRIFRFNEEYLGFNPYKQVIKTEINAELYENLEQIERAYGSTKDYRWLRGKKYEIVRDDNLEEILDIFRKTDKPIYYDTETTGLKIRFTSRINQGDVCVGVILSVEEGESYYFPMQMKAVKNLCGGDHWFFMEYYLREILEGKKLVGHNAAFDWRVSYIYDINPNFVDDTMIMFKLGMGCRHEKMKIGLKHLAKRFLNRDSLELADLVRSNSWGESEIYFWDLPPELTRLYACADTDNTRGIYKYAVENELLRKENAERVYLIELFFSFSVAYQEFYGMPFNVKNWEYVKQKLLTDTERLSKEMLEIVGHEFNPKSAQQLMEIMYNELGYPEQRDRQSGKLTADKGALKVLGKAENLDGEALYPFARLLTEFRDLTAIHNAVKQFNTLATDEGFLFPRVLQFGARTGRVTTTEPNYQGFNDDIKKNIVPRRGFYEVDTDYSSVEYRVLANMAGNEKIKKGFEDPDFDYHAYQAGRMYNVPYGSVTKVLRKAAKGINFGLPYGMGDESLGVTVFGEASAENTKQAGILRKKYFEGQDDIRLFFENTRDRAVINEYTETFFGRRRYYFKEQNTIAKIRRQAGNAVIQGTAGDLYKLAIGRLFLRLGKENLLGRVLFTGFIHDELLGEVNESVDPAFFMKIAREEMSVPIEGWCPLYTEFGFGESWYQAKSNGLEPPMQDTFVGKYAENGVPYWNGDIKEFFDTMWQELKEFEINHMIAEFTAEEKQGKEIKVETKKRLYGVMKAKDSVDGLQKVLSDFCEKYGVDRAKINIFDVGELNAENQVKEGGEIDYEALEKELTAAERFTRLREMGLDVDFEEKIVSLAIFAPDFMKLLQKYLNSEQGYAVRLVNLEDKKEYKTEFFIILIFH